MDTSLTRAAVLAVAFVALYAAHHIGDYWVQTDHQAAHKGDPHRKGTGRGACLRHVLTYVFTQAAFLGLAVAVTGLEMSPWAAWVSLLVSGVTHYWADRRWTLEWLARMIPGKLNFYRLGTPQPRGLEVLTPCSSCHGAGVGGDAADESTGGKCWDCRGGGTLPVTLDLTDNPTLGTGAWALDQSFHLLFSVFVPALILATFA